MSKAPRNGGYFMPSVQDYKLFTNSLDFEKIYKESLSSLIKLYPDIQEFYNKYTSRCIYNKTIKLLYNDSEVIGYAMYSIQNRTLKFHFYYITCKNKNRKFGRFFRDQIFETLKDKVDNLETSIDKTNFCALNAAKKSAEKLNLKFSLKEINNPLFICKQYVCEIRKKS
jgi:hypothetical protein